MTGELKCRGVMNDFLIMQMFGLEPNKFTLLCV